MAENTEISWCDHTFNPWEGCQKVGPGCDNCYAEARNARFGGGAAINWGPGAPRRRTSVANWKKPLQWNREAEAFQAQHGRRQRVFCSSLADVFDNAVDPQWRHDLLDLIIDTPNLDWLLLTKRIGNAQPMMARFLDASGVYGDEQLDVWDNVWLGATIVNQEEADRDIPKLLATPAAVRFLSMEPLLGPVDLTDLVIKAGVSEHHFSALDCDVDPADDEWNGATVDWVIVGGESGLGARPMHPDWARSLRDQCATAGVPFHFKQNGEFASVSEVAGPGAHFYFPDGATVRRVGKKAAGRLIDGREHNGFPGVA